MRILPIHPVSEYNIGDLLTYYGSRYLMQEAFGDYIEFLHMDIVRSENEEQYIKEYNWGDVDAILLCGSPFLGLNPNDSKLRMLQQARDRYPEAKVIALGIGSSFRHNNVAFNNYYDYSNKTCCTNDLAISITKKSFTDYDLIVVRDIFTKKLFDLCDIIVEHYYDTAGFAKFNFCFYTPIVDEDAKRTNRYFIFTNPLLIDSWAHVPEAIWQTVIKWQLNIIKDSEFETIVTTSADKAYLDSIGIKSSFITDIRYLTYCFLRAKKVVSTRVHQAIYAKSLGVKDVTVIPFDSRFVSALNFDIDVGFPKIKLSDYSAHLEDYRLSILKDSKELIHWNKEGILKYNGIGDNEIRHYVELLRGGV